MTDHAGVQDVVHRQVVGHERLWIELGPVPGGDGDFGQLLAGGAELVHVARCSQRIGARRHHRLVRIFIRVRFSRGCRCPPYRALRAAIGNDNRLAKPSGDSCLGVCQMRHEG